MNSKLQTILVHLPAYRDPELVPTIKNALENAKYPKRIHFGICRQFCETDEFDNLDEFRKDSRFHIMDVPYKEAKGLPWARAQINEKLLTDQDYILQLDSHHRFEKNWDATLIEMHSGLEADGYKPILAAYLPLYTPFDDPGGRTMEPWQQTFVCFYPHGTIFIRPGLLTGWQDMTKPPMSRFLSGHFCFARSEWAKEIRHDPDIYFSGEELNLTVRSYTHGYDLFHPHKLVVWHSTMREERAGMLKWDDDAKLGVDRRCSYPRTSAISPRLAPTAICARISSSSRPRNSRPCSTARRASWSSCSTTPGEPTLKTSTHPLSRSAPW